MKKGTKLVCIAKNPGWVKQDPVKWLFGLVRSKKTYGPKFNEVVTYWGDGNPGFIYLKEYIDNGAYQANLFEPLIEDENLIKELASETIKQN